MNAKFTMKNQVSSAISVFTRCMRVEHIIISDYQSTIDLWEDSVSQMLQLLCIFHMHVLCITSNVCDLSDLKKKTAYLYVPFFFHAKSKIVKMCFYDKVKLTNFFKTSSCSNRKLYNAKDSF